MPDTRILIVYDTNGGHTYRLAQLIARGVERVEGCEAVVRRVAKVTTEPMVDAPDVPASGAPYVALDELAQCDGLIIGSPTHFGVMSASLKHFLDQTTEHWFGGTLTGKPGAAFTSTGSLHGGQEATLLGLLVPLMHHGMLITGLPYSHPELMQTTRGGTPYGPSHVAGESGDQAVDAKEAALCRALGARVGELAVCLKGLKGSDASSAGETG